MFEGSVRALKVLPRCSKRLLLASVACNHRSAAASILHEQSGAGVLGLDQVLADEVLKLAKSRDPAVERQDGIVERLWKGIRLPSEPALVVDPECVRNDKSWYQGD